MEEEQEVEEGQEEEQEVEDEGQEKYGVVCLF